MALKTSEAMPIHGADGIHVMPGRQHGSVCFVWGEAKLYKTLSSALDAACTSIKGFVERAGRRAPIGREIDIIRDHLDTTMHSQLQSFLLDALDPYTPAYNQREEAFACFVGFDYDIIQKIHSIRGKIGNLPSCKPMAAEFKVRALYSRRSGKGRA
jgi:Cap4 SAVED domain